MLVHFSRNGSSLSLCLSLALSASFESHCMCCAYADRWRKEEEKEFDTKGTKKKYRKQATYTPWLFNAGKELSIIPPENSSSSLFGLVERSRERTWGRVNKRKATICWRKKQKNKKKKKRSTLSRRYTTLQFYSVNINFWIENMIAIISWHDLVVHSSRVNFNCISSFQWRNCIQNAYPSTAYQFLLNDYNTASPVSRLWLLLPHGIKWRMSNDISLEANQMMNVIYKLLASVLK